MNPMKTLMGALPIVAAAFGRKFGVQVLVGGDQAWTNGKTIYIPAIGEDSDAATLAWGYLTHEAGHCRETDMDVYTKTARRDPLTANVLNILEDVRTENAIRRAYPGSRKWLDNTVGWLSSNGRFNPPKKEDPPPKVLASSLLLMARHRYCQQSFLKEDAAKAEEVLRQVFPPTFVHRYLGLLTDIPGLNSTADTAELALRIRGLIEEEAEEPPPPEPPGQSGEDGDEGEDAGDDASEPEDAEGEDEGDGDDAGQSEDTEGEDDGDRAGQSGDDRMRTMATMPTSPKATKARTTATMPTSPGATRARTTATTPVSPEATQTRTTAKGAKPCGPFYPPVPGTSPGIPSRKWRRPSGNTPHPADRS